jgi:hypothetical protein
VAVISIVGGSLVGLVTPSLGQFYAGKIVSPGLGIRAIGLVVVLVGGMRYAATQEGCDPMIPHDCDVPGKTWALLGAGAALYFGGAILDIVDAPETARRHKLQVEPIVACGITGLSLVGNF